VAEADTYVTTEHFTLQGARASTIAESTGRATMFLSSVSGGLVALGLVATATHLGRAFYAFALVLLPVLSFVGLVTFERTLQSGIEDHGYARRIATLRGYYFEQAPQLESFLLSVAPDERMHIQGLFGSRGQRWRTIAGMIAVITSALAASAVGIAAALLSHHSLAAALIAGGVAFAAIAAVLSRVQGAAWARASTTN
jgi:VIT1/CCC1 family predicted Fe2+/Mn2+ transporter